MNQSEDNSTKILIIILAVLGGGMLVCCGVGVGAFYWMRNAANDFMDELAELDEFEVDDDMNLDVRVAIEDHPVIVDHIGTITRFESDYDLWLEEPGTYLWPFHIEGEKGSGMLRAICITNDDYQYEVPSAQLMLDTGEVIELFPDTPLPTENQLEQKVQEAIAENPVILEHIGSVTRLERDYELYQDEPGFDIWPFQIEGDKGAGVLRAECFTHDDIHYEVPSAELTLETGDVFQLFPDSPLN